MYTHGRCHEFALALVQELSEYPWLRLAVTQDGGAHAWVDDPALELCYDIEGIQDLIMVQKEWGIIAENIYYFDPRLEVEDYLDEVSDWGNRYHWNVGNGISSGARHWASIVGEEVRKYYGTR